MSYSSINVKYFIVGFLFAAALATSLPCQAGDRSTDGEKKKTAKASASTKDHSVQQTAVVKAVHPGGTAFCHRGDQYCIRIAASPWWPNAPGD
jgi:hypothetical protein